MPLTAKQQAFVQEYLIDLNATQAAIRAGYKEKAAYATGAENLRKPQIAEAIAEAQKSRSERVEWSAEEILRGIRAIADNPRAEHRDRLRAYELGGRHAGMFKDKIEHSGSMGVTIQNDIPRKSP